MAPSDSYELLDSGAGGRLERFGSRVIQRPASAAIWRMGNPALWESSDAVYVPKQGWSFPSGRKFDEWEIQIAGITLLLSLQNNGQLGLFPEHLGYLDELIAAITRVAGVLPATSSTPKLLNLFAYSGLVTNFAALHGAHATHVEISKKVIDWAADNVKRNQIKGELVRFIPDEAVSFVAREVRRGSRYQLIVCDPPSFSREKKGDSWELEEVIVPLVKNLVELIDPNGGTIFLSSHHLGIGPDGLKNLIIDEASDRLVKLESRTLSLVESQGRRSMSSGFLVQAQLGSLAK